jgi:hypothetical protein
LQALLVFKPFEEVVELHCLEDVNRPEQLFLHYVQEARDLHLVGQFVNFHGLLEAPEFLLLAVHKPLGKWKYEADDAK